MAMRKINKTDPYDMFYFVPTSHQQYKMLPKQLYKIKHDQAMLKEKRESQEETVNKWKTVAQQSAASSSGKLTGAWVIGPAPPVASDIPDEEDNTHGLLPTREKQFIYDNWNGVGQPGAEWTACQDEGWWFHQERALYYLEEARKYFKIEEKTQVQYELDPFHSPVIEASVLCRTDSSSSGSGSSDPAAATTKTVLIKDLISVGQALKMPLDFLDRPASLFAIFAKAGTGMQCVDYCTKNLHIQFLKMFRTYHGAWDTLRVHYMIRAAFMELEKEFAKKNPEGAKTQGCSAGVCLLLGSRLFVAAVGGCRAVSFVSRSDDEKPQVIPLASMEESPTGAGDTARGSSSAAADEEMQSGPALAVEQYPGGVLIPGRVIGCLDDLSEKEKNPKAEDADDAVDGAANALSQANPKSDAASASAHADITSALSVQGEDPHALVPVQGEDPHWRHPPPEPSFALHVIEPHLYKMQMILMVIGDREKLAALSPEETLAPAEPFLKLRKPRAICGAVSQKVAAGNAQALAFAVDFLTDDRMEDDPVVDPKRDPEHPKAKRQKTELSEFSQVRIRHILLRFVGCRIPAELATKLKKKATRTREDAEAQARELLQELQANPMKFPQRAKELSECNSALKMGPAAGDMGWIGRGGKAANIVEPQMEDASFRLEKNEFSDVVISESGCHIIQRIA